MAPIKLQFKDLVTKGLDSGAPEQEASPSKPASMLKKKKKVGMKKPKPVFTVFDVLKLAKKPKMTQDEGLVLKGFNVPNGYSLVINTSSTNKTLQSGEYSGGPYTYQEVANGQVEGWQLVPNQSQTAYEGQDYFTQQQVSQQQQVKDAENGQEAKESKVQPDPQYQMPWDQSDLFGNGDDSDPFASITFDESEALDTNDLTSMVQGVLNYANKTPKENYDDAPGKFIQTARNIKDMDIYGDIIVDPSTVGSMHFVAFMQDMMDRNDFSVLRDLIDSQDEALTDAVLNFDKTYMTGDWETMEMTETFLRLMYATDEGLSKSQSFNSFVDNIQNFTPQQIENYIESISEKFATYEAVVVPLQAKLQYESDIATKGEARTKMMDDLISMQGDVKRMAEDGDIVGAILAAQKSTAYNLFAFDVLAYDAVATSTNVLDTVMQFASIQSYSEIINEVKDGMLDSLLSPDQIDSVINSPDEDTAIYNLGMALSHNQLTEVNSDDKLFGVLSSMYANPAEPILDSISQYALALGKLDASPGYVLGLAGLSYSGVLSSGNMEKLEEKKKLREAIKNLVQPNLPKTQQPTSAPDIVKAQQSRDSLLSYIMQQGTKIPRFLADSLKGMQLTGREAFFLDMKDPADLIAALPSYIQAMLETKPLDYHAPFITENMLGGHIGDELTDMQLSDIMHALPLYQIEGMTPAESRMHHIMNSMEPKVLDALLRNPYAKLKGRMAFRTYMQSCFEDSVYEKLGQNGIDDAYRAIWAWTTGPLGVMSTTGMAMKYYWANSRGERDAEQEWGLDKRKNPWQDHRGRTQPADYVDIIRQASELGPVLDVIHDLSSKLFKATLGDHNKGPLPGSKVVYRGMYFNPGTAAHDSFQNSHDFMQNSTPKINTLASFSHTREIAERFAESTFEYGAYKGVVESVITAKDAAIDCRLAYGYDRHSLTLKAGTHNSAVMGVASYEPKTYNDYTNEDELITYSASENPARYMENTLDQDGRTTMKVIHGLGLGRK